MDIWVHRRRARRQKADGVIECALRDKNDVHSVLTDRWIHCEAQLDSGRITVIKRFRFYGFRLWHPSTDPIEIHVLGVSGEQEVTWGWNFAGAVYDIETPNGIIELGLALVTDRQWAIDRIAPPSGPTSSSTAS